MCGIVACKTETGTRINTELLSNALKVISHRGPDSSAFLVSNNKDTILGHTRLSIIDLESGSQPIVNKEHKISIVVNGEFYGYKQLRRSLIKKGHRFVTNTDSEILIFLYIEYGFDLIKHLRGEFAFVLYDENKDLLFAGRDRFGIKPFCFYKDNEKLLIASEAKALFELGVPRAWDEYAFMHASSMHYQPTDRTLFKDIKQLPPGHFLLYKNSQLEIKKYWDLDYKEENDTKYIKTEEEYIEEFDRILTESIKLRLVSDVPACFHLSGGLDSSALVGYAGKRLHYKTECFTIAFDGKDNYDEASLARETAEFAGISLNMINVSQQDILDNLEDAVYYSEGLAINGHISCKYLLNRAIKRAGYKVALTGEGADETLAGYPHLRQDIFELLPEEEKKKSIDKLYATNLAITGVEIPQGAGLNIEAVRNKLGYIPSFLQAKATIGQKVHSVLQDGMLSQYAKTDFYSDMLNSYDLPNQVHGRHVVNQSLYFWIKLTLVNYILGTLGDGCEMSGSVEGRLPFLDHKLFEFARNLPMNLKINNGVEKYILREASKPYITDKIYKRQKHPFMAPPITRFCSKQNLEFIVDNLKSKGFREMPFFDSAKVNCLLEKLQGMDVVELTSYEPVVMFMLTASFINKRYMCYE